ncbi:primosomal replication protein PriC [secondary endosymbiont of Ctenarytaina eucalypti]|uniref:primosomal replication protein PriC n=1 Tax=secondary endosymbiont of Ctenarytaina eucalypti TaxID=1199245 RepID=UPI000302520A|nr:primosomal replication protein [secondary endosymbiont of Ctenarytaina eucalypti]
MRAFQLLTVLSAHLNNLGIRLETQGQHVAKKSCFDHLLFATRSNRLSDYMSESRTTLSRLSRAVEIGQADRVRWLSQRLIDQMSALSRQLTLNNISQNPSSDAEEDIYALLAKHQNYERRLQAMIRDRYSLCSTENDHVNACRLQKEIAALGGRLQRCQEALTRVEYQIERQEQEDECLTSQ